MPANLADPWRLRVRCASCGQSPRIALAVILTPEAKKRTGYDVAVTCGSLYCRDRAENGVTRARR